MKRIAVIGVAVALLMFGNVAGALAQAEQQQGDQNKEHGKKKDKQAKDDEEKAKANKGKGQAQQQMAQPQPQGRQPVAQQPQQQPAQRQETVKGQLAQQQQAQQQQTLRNQQAQQLSQQEQQQRFAQQQQRTSAYQANLDEQVRTAQAQNVQLQTNRQSQYLIQQQYEERLRQQQVQVQRDRNYDYGSDAFFSTPWSYRYNLGGKYHRTNRYGAELLQRSVNYGYQEGFRAGDADRLDRWRYNYRDSFAYQDANYGYVGRYVDQDDYNSYFRLGFRKGYDDGYYRRSRYGRRTNGNFTVLKVVLSGILKLEVIR